VFTAFYRNWVEQSRRDVLGSPRKLGVHELGYTFTGWGLMLAIFAVFCRPASRPPGR
jgi:hypothetical protein